MEVQNYKKGYCFPILHEGQPEITEIGWSAVTSEKINVLAPEQNLDNEPANAVYG